MSFPTFYRGNSKKSVFWPKISKNSELATFLNAFYEKSMKNDQAMKDKNGKIVKPKFRGFAFIGFRNLAQAETVQTKLHIVICQI